MPDRPAAVWQAGRSETGDLLQTSAQIVGICLPDLRFLGQFVELLQQHGRLEMLHAEVAAAGKVAATLQCSPSTAAVMERITAVDELLAVAGDRAAFTGRKMLGVLEAEATQVGERAAHAAFVFCQPGLARVLDQDTENCHRQWAGMNASLKAGQTLGNYQEARIRNFHNTLDDYLQSEAKSGSGPGSV